MQDRFIFVPCVFLMCRAN